MGRSLKDATGNTTTVPTPVTPGTTYRRPHYQKQLLFSQDQPDDAEEKPESAEERQRLVFADHTEDGAHDLDAVADGVKLGAQAFVVFQSQSSAGRSENI